jgi:hypothetical protein
MLHPSDLSNLLSVGGLPVFAAEEDATNQKKDSESGKSDSKSKKDDNAPEEEMNELVQDTPVAVPKFSVGTRVRDILSGQEGIVAEPPRGDFGDIVFVTVDGKTYPIRQDQLEDVSFVGGTTSMSNPSEEGEPAPGSPIPSKDEVSDKPQALPQVPKKIPAKASKVLRVGVKGFRRTSNDLWEAKSRFKASKLFRNLKASRYLKNRRRITAGLSFNKWLDTFIEEKGIDLEDTFEVEGPSGTNVIPYGVVIEHMKIASPQEQAKIKNMLVRLDFKNADIKNYLRHLGQAITASKDIKEDLVTDEKDPRRLTYKGFLARLRAEKITSHDAALAIIGYLPKNWDSIVARLAKDGVQLQSPPAKFDVKGLLNKGYNFDEVRFLLAAKGVPVYSIDAVLKMIADAPEPTTPRPSTPPKEGYAWAWNPKVGMWVEVPLKTPEAGGPAVAGVKH